MKKQQKDMPKSVTQPSDVCNEFVIYRLDCNGDYIQQSIWFESYEKAKAYFDDYNNNNPEKKPMLLGRIH